MLAEPLTDEGFLRTSPTSDLKIITLEDMYVCLFVGWLVGCLLNVPATRRVYLRDESAQANLHATTLR